jgi:hypothetical protein
MAKRSDSAHVQTQIMKDAVLGVQPPDCVRLDERHMPFFKYITEARAQWTNIDLIHAANLARCMYEIEYESAMLEDEGSVIMGGKNGTTRVMNPRFSALETLSRRSVAISAKIQVHAAATIGEVENNKNKNAAKQKSVSVMQDLDDDDMLIGRPVN